MPIVSTPSIACVLTQTGVVERLACMLTCEIRSVGDKRIYIAGAQGADMSIYVLIVCFDQ